MKIRPFLLLLGCLLICLPYSHAATPAKKAFSFGVIAHHGDTSSEESTLQADLDASDEDNLAFVVVNGVKAKGEPCTDDVYNERLKLLDNAGNGLILSLTANDWVECLNGNGKPAAVERLNRIRELFFSEQFSLGASRMPVIRQSITPKFRSYSENMRWLFRNVLFATINLPEKNNNYRSEAGRNSEFEDRLIANEDWLQKTFAFAKRRKLNGIVLFCDGNPLNVPSSESLDKLKGKRDGFLETRKQLTKLAADFPGKVLIIHRQVFGKKQAYSNIAWSRNLGQIGVSSGWVKISVSPTPSLFAVQTNPMARTETP